MTPLVYDSSEIRAALYPFAEIRSTLDIRLGILTLREKWERLLAGPLQETLSPVAPEDGIRIPANLVPTRELLNFLKDGSLTEVEFADEFAGLVLRYPWQLIELNEAAIRADYELITEGRYSVPIPETVQTIRSTNIFVEEGAVLQHCLLNATDGPIYIARNAIVMEGCLIRGPFALGENAVLKMGTKIYGGTSVGPECVIGGELKNALVMGYSNKAHDGYLGDSVVAEWCNLGAGCSNSNLRNTASPVNVWHRASQQFLPAGLKCGLLMGDYSRAAINTAFNTGTVVGLAANVLSTGLTPKYIPDFSWGDPETVYDCQKALSDIANWKKLKQKSLSEQEIQTLKSIFERR